MNDYDLKSITKKLEQHINTCNLSILIGAGFSKPSFPDMPQIKIIFKELLTCLKEKLEIENLEKKLLDLKLDKFLTNNNILLTDSLNKIFAYFKENINFQDLENLLKNLDSNINFEEILYKSNIEKIINSKSDNLSNCFIFLFFEIFKIVKEKNEYIENIKKNQELIKWLFKKNEFHVKRSIKDTINIFTTNYDILIEETLESLNYYYYNGFHGSIIKSFNPDFYDYSYFDDMNLNKNFYQVKKSIFNLYKLHGSVTWQIKVEENEHLLTEIGIQKEILVNNKNIIYPHIIYPSIDKYDISLNYEHYYDLLRKFKDVLYKEDSCLLIFGFSLKDNHVWKIINNALSRGKISVFIFTSEEILIDNKLDDNKISQNFRKEIINKNGINFVCIKDFDFYNFFKNENNSIVVDNKNIYHINCDSKKEEV